MVKKWKTYLLIVQTALICGCGESERPRPETRVAVESAPTSSVPDEVAMAVAEIERDLSTLPYAVTNWSRADAVAHQISGKIIKLPPTLSEQYGRRMAQTIVSVPINHLSRSARFRTLVAMFNMLNRNVGWRDMKRENLWELRIMSLKCYREAIDYAQKDEKDDWNTRSYVELLSDNLNGYSEFWERDLAYRVSKAIPPNQYAYEVRKVPDEEYFAIRKRFEDFLGRPIRSYEEIVRFQRERDRQSKLARERRPTDSDVKVDVGDL